MPAKFEILTIPPENTNSVLMTVGNDAVIFDPWGHGDDWAKLLGERGLGLRAIYTTHGHGDHIAAAPALAMRYNVPWYLNAADAPLIKWSEGLLEYFGLPSIDKNTSTHLPAGQFEILPGAWADVISVPGHSAGGMAFYFRDSGILIIGDTLFATGVGRTDLPGGNQTALTETITRLMNMNFPDETFVIPGHGYASTWGEMRRVNPYIHSVCGCGYGQNSCTCHHEHAGPGSDHKHSCQYHK